MGISRLKYWLEKIKTPDTCRELEVGFVAHSPLGRGFLTGRFKRAEDLPENDWRRFHPRFQGDNFQRNLHLADTVHGVAADKGCTPSQLLLAWILTRGDSIVPIPGTRHIRYLEEDLGALGIGLSAGEQKRLEDAFPLGVAAGERYTPQGMQAIDR